MIKDTNTLKRHTLLLLVIIRSNCYLFFAYLKIKINAFSKCQHFSSAPVHIIIYSSPNEKF